MTSLPSKRTETSKHCPLCRKETEAAFRPFCSKKCKMVDLYKWVSGHYVIPGDGQEVLDREEKEAKEEWQEAWNEEEV